MDSGRNNQKDDDTRKNTKKIQVYLETKTQQYMQNQLYVPTVYTANLFGTYTVRLLTCVRSKLKMLFKKRSEPKKQNKQKILTCMCER